MIKRLADRFFRWFCHPDYYDEIQGDLEEMYQRDGRQSKRSVQLGGDLESMMNQTKPKLM